MSALINLIVDLSSLHSTLSNQLYLYIKTIQLSTVYFIQRTRSRKIGLSNTNKDNTNPFESDRQCAHITVKFARKGSFEKRALASYPGKF